MIVPIPAKRSFSMAVLKKESNLQPVNGTNVHTILGPESTFEGKLSFEGTVRIDGNYKGEIITTDTLIVGQSATVEGTLKVGSIIVNGEVRGDVTASQLVELKAPARWYGNIETPQLMIERGVVFQGSCQMDKSSKPSDPKSRMSVVEN